MIAVMLMVGWSLVGAWSATAGLSPRERDPVWTLAGAIFGPLWWLVRVDRTPMSRGTDQVAAAARHRLADDVHRARAA
jgi:hypothetical protein